MEKFRKFSKNSVSDIPNMKNIVPGNTKFITIIREPVSNVESAFGFYRDQEPFEQWMPTIAANSNVITKFRNFQKNLSFLT